MKVLLIIMLVGLHVSAGSGQNVFRAIIRDSETLEPLAGATAAVNGTPIGASAGSDGSVTLQDIPDGSHVLVFSLIGYERVTRTFTFPLSSIDPIEVLLTPKEKELDEVVVSTTRGSRTISDEPTRMEVVTAEELDEKSTMKPGDIRMLLSESTGIHIQQTSATTANAGIRIQGLDGRYTQILKDGFPLYAGFAGTLSIMQIPPLDLHQVEVIKGSASTLYGGGAIAGLINLISKTPSEETELSLLMNGTSAGGLDLSGFYSGEFDGVGLTAFAARNSNAPYDPAGIDLTAIPEVERYTFNPRLFLHLGGRSELSFGINTSHENRLGGDMHYIRSGGDSIHSYFERNKSSRIGTQLSLDHWLGDHFRLTLKNSVSLFNRVLEIPQYRFDGSQVSTFSEAVVSTGDRELEWVAGTNLITDKFSEAKQDTVVPRDYSQSVVGAFVQNTWMTSQWLTIESGLRVDYAKNYGAFVLPRLSALFTLATNFTSRIGGGWGYKLPTVFTEEAEAIQFRNVLPINETTTSAEKSVGGNIDVNLRGILFGELTFSVNQMFYYTKLDNPLTLTTRVDGQMQFVNANGHIDTEGVETNAKLGYEDLKLFLGYTLTDAKRHEGGMLSEVLLTPRHRVNAVLMFELHDEWRIGLEGYYFSTQRLSDQTIGRAYWICGFMAERMWERLSLFINFENFLDTRQTRYGSIYTGTITRPQFKELFAPVDGFVLNGGIKLRL